MIVATRPLIDCCPIVPAAMEGRQIVQWDKDSCSDAGFLKIDLLGLGMLSAVERTVELIARTRGERIDLSRIPYDDPPPTSASRTPTPPACSRSRAGPRWQSLRRTRPENLKDITIQVAIVRPGPIQGGAVNPYIERRQRLRVDPDYQVPYDHPSLEAVLGETLGTIIFQDQVLEVSIAFAGFSPGEAEGLRRAMSRKRSEAAIEAYHERFVIGAQRKHGVDARDRRAGVRDGQGLLRLRLPQGSRSRLRAAGLPVDLAARPLHAGAAVLAAQRAADGLLPARRARPRGPAPGDRGAGARRQRERGRVRGAGRAGRAGPDRARLRPGGARRRGAGAGRRPGGGRALPQPVRPGLAGRLGRLLAGAAGLVGGLRLAGRWQRLGASHGPLAAGGDDARAPGSRRHPAGAAARSARAALAARAVGLGGDAGRLRHHRPHGGHTRWRCCATGCPRTW